MTTQKPTQSRAAPAASHTPGPWSITRDEYRDLRQLCDRSRGDVAVILLAALMFAKDGSPDANARSLHANHLCGIIRAAIAKAEGRAL